MAHNLLRWPVPQRPTALVCLSDLVATRAISGVLDPGARVPDDLALCGHDDAR
ncbi:MAG TPA: hypothetical protein DEP84_24880 [Chloroflexi bacterium]|nr:hypothetical protein [Chloroflexota bacterium]